MRDNIEGGYETEEGIIGGDFTRPTRLTLLRGIESSFVEANNLRLFM